MRRCEDILRNMWYISSMEQAASYGCLFLRYLNCCGSDGREVTGLWSGRDGGINEMI